MQPSDPRYRQRIDRAGMWKVYEITAGSLKSLYRRAISGPDHPLKYRLGISISEGPERCRDHIEHGAIEARKTFNLEDLHRETRPLGVKLTRNRPQPFLRRHRSDRWRIDWP